MFSLQPSPELRSDAGREQLTNIFLLRIVLNCPITQKWILHLREMRSLQRSGVMQLLLQFKEGILDKEQGFAIKMCEKCTSFV